MTGGKKDLKAIFLSYLSYFTGRLATWILSSLVLRQSLYIISSGHRPDHQEHCPECSTEDFFLECSLFKIFLLVLDLGDSVELSWQSRLRLEKILMMIIITVVVVVIITGLIYRKPPRLLQDSVKHFIYAVSTLVIILQLLSPYSTSFHRQNLPKNNYHLLFYILTSSMLLIIFLS